MKKQNSYLPFTKEEIRKIKEDGDELSLLFLYTGIRRFELPRFLIEPIESNAVKLLGKGNKYRFIPVNEKIMKLKNDLKGDWEWKTTRSINNHFQKQTDKLGFKISTHKFRATFATNLIEMGVDLVTIQTLMGHASINTTAEYIKINMNNLQSTINMITNPKYSLDGMTVQELKQEIIRLRKRVNRNED